MKMGVSHIIRRAARQGSHAAVAVGVLLVTMAAPVIAQGPGAPPDPMDAVRLFDASRSNAHASNIAFECPSASEWRRVAIHGILDLDISTPQDISTVAGALNGVLKNCDDARVRAWYHEKLRGLTTAEHRSAASQIASALMFAAQPDWLPDGTLAVVHQFKENPPAPEDLEVMLEVATDPTRDDSMRQGIMGHLTWIRHHEIRAEILVRAYRMGVPPRLYRGGELGQLFRGPERDRVALDLARLVRDDPGVDPTGGLARVLTWRGIDGLGPPSPTPDPARWPPSTARQVLEEMLVLYERLDTLPEGPVRDALARAGPRMREALGRPPGG
jgi:hypothetical protein